MSTNQGNWLILCRVIDNYGDIGVTWRLARQLANEHQISVEFWIDDISRANAIGVASFRSERGAVTVREWTNGLPCPPAHCFDGAGLGKLDTVIAAFACQTPEPLMQQMRLAQTRNRRPVQWINLEYLSAESWIEGSHLLSSPKYGLTETFYFPGWFENTGGLLREAHLATPPVKQMKSRQALLANLKLEQLVAINRPELLDAPWIHLFCYPHAPLSALIELLRQGNRPALVLIPDGVASKSVAKLELFAHPRGPIQHPGAQSSWFQLGQITIARVPMLSQEQYDDVLAQCDLNFVRGEDSLVRAIWANNPFVWHIYPQEEGAHLTKLEAFAERVLAPSGSTTSSLAALQKWWNADSAALTATAKEALMAALWPVQGQENELREHGQRLRSRLSAQTDLTTRLLNFAAREQRQAA